MSRLFIAVLPDDALTLALNQVVPRIQQQAIPNSLHWYHNENWHMTIHFFGSVTPDALYPMWQSICAELTLVKPFTYQTNQIEVFPDPKHSRVLAVTILPNPELLNFVAQVERGILDSSHTTQLRHFRGHITLARVIDHDLVTQVPQWPEFHMTSLARELVLIESVTTTEDPIYTVVDRFVFG